MNKTEVAFSFKRVVPWVLWNMGSAGINAIATTFVFSVYLASESFGDKNTTQGAISTGIALAGVIVALTAPITGQRADHKGKGVKWLAFFSFLIVLTLASMSMIQPHPSFLIPGVILLAMGTVFSAYADVNYYALLPRVANSSNMGKISGIGWASGYFSGIFLLILVYFGFIAEGHFVPVSDANGWGVRIAMMVVALWATSFYLPILIFPPKVEMVNEASAKVKVSLIQNYKNLWRTLKILYHKAPNMLWFLLASAIFRDGLAGIFTFGGLIATATFGFTPAEVLLFGIAANVVAGVFTICLSFIEDKIGPKRLIMISLTALITTSMIVFFLHTHGKIVYWVFGLFLCIWVGPAQSASRSFMARRVPPGNENEFFGLYQTVGQAATPLAPWLYGLAITFGALLTGKTNTTYFGIIGIALVLLLGLILLARVNDKEARLDHIEHIPGIVETQSVKEAQ